ncbi:receptor-like kinase TMK3 [Pistacia vera]|uniref:receptor-like kinase TMK3 n=1 Tax=Pistacia vera TaxID=55513 RepID=UPI00126350C5|nr:receptor-like kinase TMK3 [Pistacia vera]
MDPFLICFHNNLALKVPIEAIRKLFSEDSILLRLLVKILWVLHGHSLGSSWLIKNLSSLTVLDVANNQLTGPIPSLAGLTSLQEVNFCHNNFSYMPSDFFQGLKSLRLVALDINPFSAWELPQSLKEATSLQFFTASHSNISGSIPDFFGRDTFPGLMELRLAKDNLEGQIPPSFAKSSVQKLWLYSQKLNGSVAVLQNMTDLTQLCLDANSFSGPLPILSGLNNLVLFSVRRNQLTGTVPLSSANFPKLTTVSLADNLFQGPTPEFNKSKVHMDIDNRSNSFCLGDPGVACDSRVNILLSISESLGYPVVFAKSWKGNNPCNASQENRKGILCDDKRNITVVNFNSSGLSGTISSNFSELMSLKELILSNNSLTGSIPIELTTLPSLERLDVSDNRLDGIVPNFRLNVIVYIRGNPGLKISLPPLNPPFILPVPDSRGDNSDFIKIMSFIVVAVCGVCAHGLGVYLYTTKPKCSTLVHSTKSVEIHDPPGGNTAKITLSINEVEFGNMIIPIQVLRFATNNFSEENILGRGGFGTVYRGMLQDGTKIAVKRMESRTFTEQCLASFKSEIEVLTKVRHRHLLTLLGYSQGRIERLLVYEYLPQGTLSRHLFKWEKEGLKPLEWHRRLIIALDVARGVEYC